MEFDVFTTNVVLQDIPSYTTSITLEGQLLRLSFIWNERIGYRVLAIKNSRDEYYLQNTILYPNEAFELNSNAVFDDLPYKVVLQKTGDVSKVGNIFNWSKDFILCFSRTVDLDVKKLNVVYGVTTPSTPILPPPTPAFGDWILNQGFTILGDDIRYTGYKTNGIDTYDSFATFSLETALVRSFYDTDMRQWQAFKDAVNELTGVTDWVFDSINNRIFYTESNSEFCATFESCPSNEYLFTQGGKLFTTALAAGQSRIDELVAEVPTRSYTFNSTTCPSNPTETLSCNVVFNAEHSKPYTYTVNVSTILNPSYNPNAEGEVTYLPLPSVAQKIISNTLSSNEGISLLAEAYIDEVTNSIFDSDESKQFVKMEDLIDQFEENKVLR